MSEVLHGVVSFRNHQVAVVRNRGAITEIAGDQPPVIDTEQLIEVWISGIVEDLRCGLRLYSSQVRSSLQRC
jgi:hypothetical protein